jgi:hypothetical protein
LSLSAETEFWTELKNVTTVLLKTELTDIADPVANFQQRFCAETDIWRAEKSAIAVRLIILERYRP